MARAATAPELALFRAEGKWSQYYAAILKMSPVYRARVNQTFTDNDQVLSIVYDGASGTYASVLPDMEVWVGSSLDGHDKGICRLRDKDATHFYVSETSEIDFQDNDYLTIVPHYGLWARPVRIDPDDLTVFMDEVEYSDQHTNWDPMPNMGGHQIVELTSSSVNTSWNVSSSFCPGSSISAYAWSCGTASAASGTTTATPTFQFNTTGWHIVYLTVTAANGKQFFGVRYVYVYNDDNPPHEIQLESLHQDAETGGWDCTFSLYTNADMVDDFYDRAMVIVFSKDHYGTTQSNIGPVLGSENIRFVGWIYQEDHEMGPEMSYVHIIAKGPAFWMTKIGSWPDGVELANTSTAWTNCASLTVDKGVYHFLRWRSTITRIMDVTLSDDTRTTQEVYSSAQNLWFQIQEMTWNQIYARPGVNAQGQLFITIHPNLIPSGSRTYPTVMDITKEDWQGKLDISRSITPDVGIVDMSGVIVTAPGQGVAKFALSPGHSLPRYGAWDLQTNRLLASQDQVNTLAGLYRSWKNAEFKSIPVKFSGPVPLIDCYPNQRCTITIEAEDNIRGFEFSGGVIPHSIDIQMDPETGHVWTEVTFEEQTSESESSIGDTPGSDDTDEPPDPSFPDIPDIPPILPGVPPPGASPFAVIGYDPTIGLIYTDTFDAVPLWQTINTGLTLSQAQGIDDIVIDNNGGIYVIKCFPNAFIAYSPGPGEAFTVFDDAAAILARIGTGSPTEAGILAIGFDSVNNRVAYIAGTDTGVFGVYNIKFHLCSGASFTTGVSLTGVGSGIGNASFAALSYGGNKWIFTSCGTSVTDKQFWRLNSAGSSQELVQDHGNTITDYHRRASSTSIMYNFPFGSTGSSSDKLEKTTDNFGAVSTVGSGMVLSGGLRYQYHEVDCDPTGNYVVTRGPTGLTLQKSSDGGVVFTTILSLPAGRRCNRYAGPGEEGVPQWLFGGATIYYSADFGVTAENRSGNLNDLVISPDVRILRVYG